jgi:hypothetical protein
VTARAGVAVAAAIAAFGSPFAPTALHRAEPRRAPPTLGDASPPALAPLTSAPSPAPADLRATVTPEQNGIVVEVERPGHLVALMRGRVRAAAASRASVELLLAIDDVRADALPGARFVWETTNLATRATERGLVTIALDRGVLRATIGLAPAAPRVAAIEGAGVSCGAHADGAGGFVVLCAVETGSGCIPRSVSGESPDYAATLDREHGVVRLDLPLGADESRVAPRPVVESRVVVCKKGGTLTLVQADATWVPGEAPVVALTTTTTEARPLPIELPRGAGSGASWR